MTWQVYIGICIIFYSIGTIFQKYIFRTERIDPVAFSIIFQIITGLIIGMYALLSGKLIFPDLSNLTINLILMVILYMLGNILLFRSIEKIDASEFTVIFSSRVLFTILASTIILHEGLTLVQFFGTLLIIASIALVSLKKSRISLNKFELLAIGASICMGFANTNDRILLKSFETYTYVTIAFLFPALGSMILKPESVRMIAAFSRKLILKLIAYCMIFVVSSITFFIALQLSPNSSQVASLNLTSVILTVILSIIFLGEKEHIARKLIGAILSIAGVLLLT